MTRCWLGDRLADESAQHDAECEACRGVGDEVARLQAQIAKLRAWMAEYPNDKYTGAWWLAEFDRIVEKPR